MASRFILPLADVGAGITPSDGAKLFFSPTGVDFDTTEKDTYSDRGATTPNANPVIADSTGVFPEIWIVGSYKVVLKDKNDVQIWEEDPVIATADTSASSLNFDTLAEAVASPSISDGNVLNIKERTSGNGGGAFWDVVLSTTVTENTYDIVQCTGVATLSLVYRPSTSGIDVEAVGAVKDTDSTGALKAAFALLSTNRVLTFPRSVTYLFDPDTAEGIDLNAVTNFVIHGNGATIKCIDSAPNVADGVIMWLEDCTDGKVYDLNFDGNLANRTGTVSAGSHDIKLRNGNARIDFINCRFDNATNDGFYMDKTALGTQGEDIRLINCHSTGCYRGGG